MIHDLLINPDNAANSCICSCTSERYWLLYFFFNGPNVTGNTARHVRALKEREAQGEPG